ncbi:DUF397 domain-containing protein [Longimycelium tulufanense]|uniref:DUF397 domain-containing protein n=1 Tax=Longimycelium tulufanense TaxID=907463 RepID=UPI0016668521|nr:DUF397 domain-containing protein [Longimycelium tulufanense]
MMTRWRLSSRTANTGSCVEVAGLPPNGAAIRDSKNRSGPILWFNRAAFTAFVETVKAGRADRSPS